VKVVLFKRKIFKVRVFFELNKMLRIKKISEVVGKKVYTDSGDLFGEVEEVNLVENKVDGWRIKVGGHLGSLLGGARGVIIPHQYVKAIGDIFLINKSALPVQEQTEEMGEAEIEEEA
jgi:sporulation protein YlmC with PRC-barrel domain